MAGHYIAPLTWWEKLIATLAFPLVACAILAVSIIAATGLALYLMGAYLYFAWKSQGTWT